MKKLLSVLIGLIFTAVTLEAQINPAEPQAKIMETKKKQKVIFFFLLLFFLLGANSVFALEIRYPNLPGVDPPQIFTKSAPIEQQFSLYVKYFFALAIWAIGVIALGALIYGGIRYLTSSGKPEELEKARKQISAVFIGLIILFSCYIILGTVNPGLVNLNIAKLKEIILSPLQYTPKTIAPQLFGKIKEIAEGVKMSSESIKNTAEKIQELTDKCTCKRTQSLCLCEGGSDGDSCQPLHCYAGPPPPEGSDKPDFHPEVDPNHHHPCPDFEEIKDNQKRIIAWKDEILYYKNRAIAEEKDLREEIDKILEEKISYYQEKLITETDEKIIESFKREIQKLNDEINLKGNLADQLNNLADSIIKVGSPASEIGVLPDECLINVEDTEICKPACEGNCHDFLEGCQPKKCEGENPCPEREIEDRVDAIETSYSKLIQTCNEILIIIDDIIKFKTITT